MQIKRTETQKSLSSRRSNARKSHGPVTRLGRERQRDSSLRHGLYSKDDDKVLRALGEDPRELADITTAVREKFPFDTGFDEALGMCLVKAMWRFRRSDRALDALALREAQDAGRWRENHLHAQSIHLKATADSLRQLLKAVSDPQYITTRADFELMDNLRYEESMVQIGDLILGLFFQLFPCGETEDRALCLPALDWSVRRSVQRIRSAFGLSREESGEYDEEALAAEEESILQSAAAEPHDAGGQDAKSPESASAECSGDERLRQLLENLLRRQAEICERYHLEQLHEALDGPSPCERAAQAIPISDSSRTMQRMHDSSFRMIWRTTGLLLKLRKPADDPDSGGAPPARRGNQPGESSAPSRASAADRSEPNCEVAAAVSPIPVHHPATQESISSSVSASEARAKKMLKMKVYPGKLNRFNERPSKGSAESSRAMAIQAMPAHGQDARPTVFARQHTAAA